MKLAFNLDLSVFCCLCRWEHLNCKDQADMEKRLLRHLSQAHQRLACLVCRTEKVYKTGESVPRCDYNGPRWSNR